MAMISARVRYFSLTNQCAVRAASLRPSAMDCADFTAEFVYDTASSVVRHICILPIDCLKPSGHYMYRQFDSHKFYVLLTQCITCFVWIWEQTAIISLCSINWLIFITETECVYCAVRKGSLYIIQTSWHYMYHLVKHSQTLHSVYTVYLCVLCGSQNKQRLFPYTTLTDWFL